ncbi:hypothetical protein [Nitrospina watsonii]|uniref:Uncharacterized protein n=1 Tax=Nitrospina watsonii TaxID=1323948 RepID=A0ABM9HFT0_9BACT|nr:hypothetical protein [Nitrospina watsonii]CAI2719024.1 conserved protein of unknown function [Nitrospina watsonii]
MTENNPQPADPSAPSAQAEFLTEEVPAPPHKPEEEINLNELFPEADQDLNDLFPEPELKTLLKKVHKQKHDIETIKDRFLEDHDGIDEPEDAPEPDDIEPESASDDTPPAAS